MRKTRRIGGATTAVAAQGDLAMAAFNLFDKRAITAFGGQTLYSAADTGFYQFQSGRTVMGTVVAKF